MQRSTKIQKVLALVLVLAMLAVMAAGCKGSTTAVTEPQAEAAAEEPAALTEEPTEEPAQENVTIRILYMSGDDNQQKMMKELIEPAIAEKFPYVTLEVEEGGSGETYENLVKTYNASGDLPDIWWSGTNCTLATIETGTSLDLKEYITADGFLAKYADPTALEDGKGKIYTISPCTDQMHICEIYYNKAIFEANNVSVPTTWDEFLSVCQTLKDNGVAPIALPGGTTSIVAFWVESLLAAVDPDVINELLENKTDWSNPACIEAYTHFKELMDAGYFQTGYEACDFATAQDMFKTGQTAMFLSMAWTNAAFDPEAVSAFLFPAIGEGVTTGDYVQCWGSPYNGYGINANGANIDVAIKVAELCVEMQATYFNDLGTASGYITGKEIAQPNDLLATINSLRDTSKTRLKFLWANSMDASTVAEWHTMNSNFVVGGFTPEEMCEKFNETYAKNTWFN